MAKQSLSSMTVEALFKLRDDVACGIRGIADRIPTQAGQHSDDCGQPMRPV